jgi:DNA polymerase III gamma/tau subunit
VRIDELMGIFVEWTDYTVKKDEKALNDFVNQQMGGAANVDILWREMLRLLEEEIAALKAAFEEEVKVQEEMDEIERDACLAPAGETWEMLTRQEMALDRSIDRKVRIILTLRKEHVRQCRDDSRTAQPAASPPGDEGDDRAAEELSEVVGLDAAAEVAPNFSSAGADPSPGSEQALKASATNHGTESPAEENPGETSKSPEQSQHVTENKGPAAEGVKA